MQEDNNYVEEKWMPEDIYVEEKSMLEDNNYGKEINFSGWKNWWYKPSEQPKVLLEILKIIKSPFCNY